MTEQNESSWDDVEEGDLLSQLQLAGQLDPVPPEAFATAKAGFAWRTLDSELAALVYDSDVAADALAGVRSAQPARLLTFEAGELTVEVEVATGAAGRRILGQLVPPQPGRVEVRHTGGVVTAEADELGRFAADGLEPGPVSLHCETSDGFTSITTDWVLL